MKQQVKCTIVMYHYVRNMHETDYPDIKGLALDNFIGQIDYILRNHIIISLEDYIEFVNGRKNIPMKSCILTFDDGLKDHYVNVFPILKSRKISACFFLLTQPLSESVVPAVHKTHFLLAKIGTKAFIDDFNGILKRQFKKLVPKHIVSENGAKEKKYRWDDTLIANLKWSIASMPCGPKVKIIDKIFAKYFENERKFCEGLYMSWDQMKEMMMEGMSFGGHSHTHPMLSQLTEEEQEEELKISQKILEGELKTKIRLFSYPYGSFNDITVTLLKEKGYTCGLSADLGINEGYNINPFTLKRIDANDIPFDKGGYNRDD